MLPHPRPFFHVENGSVGMVGLRDQVSLSLPVVVRVDDGVVLCFSASLASLIIVFTLNVVWPVVAATAAALFPSQEVVEGHVVDAELRRSHLLCLPRAEHPHPLFGQLPPSPPPDVLWCSDDTPLEQEALHLVEIFI